MKRCNRHPRAWVKYLHYSAVIAVALIALAPASTHAQLSDTNAQTLALSITPPLVHISIGPGEYWASSLRVLNTNAYPITVYGSVVDFRPSGNEGKGIFIPQNSARPNSLSTWASVSEEPVTIAPGGSAHVPFEVRIPETADAGGHYAAILVGTRPVEDDGQGSLLRVSSFVSSLLFARIEGDVHEDGFVSSFFSDKNWYENPDVSFLLTFKNTGNVHVRPEGEIEIQTMRGRVMTTLPFNDTGAYGSVLPEGVREFTVPWEWPDAQWYHLGRYRAVATVAFGEDARHNVSATTTFWYMPRQPLLWGGGGLITAVLFLVLLVRVSVARAVHTRRPRRRRRKRLPPQDRVPITHRKRATKHTYPHMSQRQDIVPKTGEKGQKAVVDLRKQGDVPK